MQIRRAARYSFVTFVALTLALGANSFAGASPRSGGQDQGGVRAADVPKAVASLAASNLTISVNYRGKAAAKAQVAVTSFQGAVVASGFTTKTGSFTASLGSGTYAVAASSKGHVATGTVTIGSSTQSVSLTLQ